jgi:pimeloyl-ACP methyl ester carboxylesterase
MTDDHATTAVGAGPGLLLAHGAGGSVEANFGSVLERLAAAHRTIGVDYPGSAHTPRSERPLTLDALADRLVRAADADGLERFAVAGFSLGGPVAIRVAARHPERVSAVLLTATYARADLRLRLATEIWSALHASGEDRLLARFLSFVALSDGALEAAGPAGLDAGIDELAAAIAPGTTEQVALAAAADVRDDARRIAVPALVLATTRDPLVSLASQHELHGLISDARLVELPSGHLPAVERPELWADEMLAFLAGTR